MARFDARNRPVLDLVDLTAQCRTAGEYELGRNEWLNRCIGFDTAYVGAALPEAPRLEPQVVGIAPPELSRCEAHIDRYWRDLITLNRAAERADGAVVDSDVLSLRARDRSPFYREVMAGLGVRTAAISVLRRGGSLIGCLYLGRLSRGARFHKELPLLKAALPALSLGKQLFDPKPKAARSWPLAPLTHREK